MSRHASSPLADVATSAPSRWPRSRSMPWRQGASTTTSMAASPATASMADGSCPTSRRCSLTRLFSQAPISTASSSRVTRAGARPRSRRSSGPCEGSGWRTGASLPRSTPTPQASRAPTRCSPPLRWRTRSTASTVSCPLPKPAASTASPPRGRSSTVAASSPASSEAPCFAHQPRRRLEWLSSLLDNDGRSRASTTRCCANGTP